MSVLQHPGVCREEFCRNPNALQGACYRSGFEHYRRALANSTEAPDEYHYLCYATAAGLVAGRRAYLSHGVYVFPNFYTVLEGPTGSSRKSTAIHFGERLLGEFGIEPITTGSWEGILEHLAQTQQGDRPGMSLLRPGEFRSLVAKARQQASGNLIPGLTELYDCPPAIRHRTKGSPVEVERPFLSIQTASTGEWLRECLAESDISGGFLNRWTFADGAPKEPIPFPEEPDPGHWAEAVAHLTEMDSMLRLYPVERGLRLEFTTEAREEWEEFYRESLRWEHPTELLAQMAQRLQLVALKLAMVYALLEGQTEIHRDHLAAGILFAKWERRCHGRVLEGFGDSKQVKLEKRILKYTPADPTGITFGALRKKLGGKYSSFEVSRTLASMGDDVIVKQTERGRLIRRRAT